MGSCTMLLLSIILVPMLVLLALSAPKAIRSLALKLRPPSRPELGARVPAVVLASVLIVGFIVGSGASLYVGWKHSEPCGQRAMSKMLPAMACASLGSK